MSTLNIAGTTSQKGVASPYQAAAKAGTSTTGIHGYDSGNIKVSGGPGVPAIKATDATIQDSTDPIVAAQDATNQADNFLASTASQANATPTMNAAQFAAAAKALAPQHE